MLFSKLAGEAIERGNYEEAASNAKCAKNTAIAAIVVGIGIIVVVGLYHLPHMR